MSMIVATYHFEPPVHGYTEVTVREHTDDPEAFDLYDQHGNCLNEGDTLYEIPSRKEVEVML